MSEEAKNQEAEQLLRKALSAFGECEPPPDLEERVLLRVRAARAKSWPRWLPVASLAAALLLGVVLIRDWRAVDAPKSAEVKIPATPSRAEVKRPVPLPNRAPAPLPRRTRSRKTPVAAPPVAAEESQISPLPQSELILSDISSSEIGMKDLGQETTSLVSDLNSDVEEGREQ